MSVAPSPPALNPYLTGLSILLVQLGGRFLTDDFAPSQKAIFGNIWVKMVVIFLILLTAIQNIWYALSITTMYYLLIYVLLHPQHPLSIMPESLKRFDLNGDGVITMDEIRSVLERERKSVDAGAGFTTTPTPAA